MSQFYKRIKKITRNLVSWWLDYVYVGFWQVVGFFRRADPKVYLVADERQKPPIILIPGIYERWQFMKPIAEVLFQAGYSVHVIERLGYNRGNIEDMSRIVSSYVEQNNLQHCIIVAHSKGGLIGKYLLANYNEHRRFDGMVALNTPFSGSTYARLLPFKSLRIFLPNSPFLLALATSGEVNERIVSIYGVFDPHIPGGSFLKGARNIQLPVSGHFKVVKDKRVHHHILQSLEELLHL